MERKIMATYLDKEQRGELEYIKQYHGIASNAETMRMLIRKEVRRIRNASRTLTDTKTEYHPRRE